MKEKGITKVKVLIVDDELGIRKGIARVLKKFKVSFSFLEDVFEYEIYEAENAAEAELILKENKIDIMLLDNVLPDKEGVEILDFVQKLGRDVAVMMITAYASVDVAAKATQKGAYNFLAKPFSPEELKNAVKDLTKYVYLKNMTRSLSDTGKEVRYQFLSILSHELKSPLNAIEGYLNIMKSKQLGDRIDDYIPVINRCLARINGMRSLILDLLDLTRIEQNKEENKKNIDIVKVAQTSVETIMPIAIQKNITIHKDFPEKLIIKGIETDFESIFNNLLSNAIKYNKDNGEVFFHIKKLEDKFFITVKDTGIGMTEEEQKKLFKEFSRIKNEKTRYIPGSGLGLSILKRLVEKYNGSIHVKSEPGEGTEFTLTFPL